MNEKEPAVYRNVPRQSDSPDEKLPGGALLDKSSFEYLFEQVTHRRLRCTWGWWKLGGFFSIQPDLAQPCGQDLVFQQRGLCFEDKHSCSFALGKLLSCLKLGAELGGIPLHL